MIDHPFLNVCNSYADERKIDLSFFRDEYDGWYCRLSFSDVRGPYSALVPATIPRAAYKNDDKVWVPAESLEAYEERIRDQLKRACVQAHTRRNGDARAAK